MVVRLQSNGGSKTPAAGTAGQAALHVQDDYGCPPEDGRTLVKRSFDFWTQHLGHKPAGSSVIRAVDIIPSCP